MLWWQLTLSFITLIYNLLTIAAQLDTGCHAAYNCVGSGILYISHIGHLFCAVQRRNTIQQ